ncbi:MAG: hypothetical protein H7289_13835 [Mucilaginibacter sp.]|nr:hypothetical protein [Mucilaginibacter sp.]
MDAELSLKEIISQVKKLNKGEKITLLQRITLLISKEEKSTKTVKLSDISGLGSSLWHNINVDEYVDSEREW